MVESVGYTWSNFCTVAIVLFKIVLLLPIYVVVKLVQALIKDLVFVNI